MAATAPSARVTLEEALAWPMHEGTRSLLRFFAYGHLPIGPLRDVSARCADLAIDIVGTTADNAERTVGLRKLLEAKDCFVRSALGGPPAPTAEELEDQAAARAAERRRCISDAERLSEAQAVALQRDGQVGGVEVEGYRA